jgi:hypothetical protein
MIYFEVILQGRISVAQWREMNKKENPEVLRSTLVIMCSNCFNSKLI